MPLRRVAGAIKGARMGAGRQEQIATRILFFVAGFGMAAWAPLVPFAQARAAIGDGALGLLLLCLGTGSIMTMSVAGALAARFGCRRVVTVAAVPLCLALPLLAFAASPTWLAIGLLVLGGSLGAIDVTMNMHAVIVERASGRSMMSGFHGLFSVGGISGAACMTAALAAGASPVVATLCVVGVIVVAMTMAGPHLLPQAGNGDEPSFAVPHGIVLFIGALCFVAFLAEGAMLDWSAVFLASAHGMAKAYAGLGYALFSLAMAIGRLLGDRAVGRFGGSTVILLGGLCAAAGFALATLAQTWQPALAGFALIGIGCANIVPVLYTSVGRQSAVPEHVAVSAITTLGYAGILAGPAMIGFVAHVSSLSAAFAMLTILLLGVAASGRLLQA
jgi:predicted MFS family arabinose efflux permease